VNLPIEISVDAICVENQAEVAKYLDIDPATVLDRLVLMEGSSLLPTQEKFVNQKMAFILLNGEHPALAIIVFIAESACKCGKHF